MELGVRLTVVASVSEADVICGLLRTEGIEARYRLGPGELGQEILVREDDFERARELIVATDEASA